MRCSQAVERMMTVDPAELRGEGESPLARHLRRCGRCHAIARTLRTDLHTLAVELDAYATAGDPEAAAERALAASRSSAGDSPPKEESPPTRPVRVRPARSAGPAWRRAAWLPLAAAAGVAALLVLGRPGAERRPPSSVEASAGAEAGAGSAAGAGRWLTVTPPADRNALVMATENPNITIVWLYERED